MKYIIFVLSFVFSINVFALTDKTNLTPEQNLVLNKIYYEIDISYPEKKVETSEFDLASYDIEFKKSSDEIDVIISSIISFGHKIKSPIDNFLETDLAIYVGIIVVVKFFGENIDNLFYGLGYFLVAFLGIQYTKKMAYINGGEIKQFQGNCLKHGKYTYKKIVYKKSGIFPFIYYISITIIFVWMFAFIF